MCDGPMLEAQKACDAVKDFATVVLDELCHDAHWLNRATDAVPPALAEQERLQDETAARGGLTANNSA